MRPFHPKPRTRQGFTLIEAALATIIIGLGVVATLSLFGTCAQNNLTSVNQTVAMHLASNIQELAASLLFNDPYYGRTSFGAESGETPASCNDVDDLDNQTFNPPIDAQRNTITGMSRYSQVVWVRPVYATKLSSNAVDGTLEIPKTTYTGAVRITVRILYQPYSGGPNQEVYRASWIRLDR